MSFTWVFIYFSILWLYLTATDFDWNGVMESNAYCEVFSTRFSLSMNRVFSIQHHVFKHHYQKGYLHLTRTFFPRRSLHVISSMLITNLGREKNYQAKLFWTVIIDNYCTLYIVAVISKTKVGILTMWPFLKTKSLKGPMTPLLWHVGNIVLHFLLVLYTPADVNLNICKECSSHLEVANIAIAYDLKRSGCWAKSFSLFCIRLHIPPEHV